MKHKYFLKLIIISTLLSLVFSLNAQTNSNYEKALQAFTIKNYKASYIHLKNALKNNSSDLAAKILMGRILLINGYFNEAVTEFEEALMAGADPNLVLKSYGKSLILTKNFKKILLLEDNELDLINQFELRLLRANAFASTGEDLKAEKSFGLALALQPENVRALNGITTLFLKNSDLMSARSYIDRSLAKDNKNASTWRLKGLFEKQSGATDEALESFKRAYHFKPNDPFVLRAYADGLWSAKKVAEAQKIIEIILKQTPDDPYAILLQSRILSATDKTEEAQNLLAKLSQDLTLLTGDTLSSNLSLRFASGMTAYLTENYEQALSDIIYYVNNSELDINTIGILADTYLRLNKERSALKLMENHETTIMENLNMSLLLCDLYLKNNRAFKCEVLATKLKSKYPDQARVDFVRAKTLVVRDKVEQAIEVLNSIKDPDYRQQRELAKAHLYFQTEEYENSYLLAEKLLEERPDDIDIINLNVALLTKKGDWPQATKLTEKILNLEPLYVPARYNKANLLGAKGNFADALKIMQELEAENALDPHAYVLYAQLLSSLHKYEEAIEKLLDTARQSDKSVPIIEKLIELYLQTDQYEEALVEVDNYGREKLADDKYALTEADLLLKLGRVEDAKRLRDRLYVKWTDAPENLIRLSKNQMRAKDYDGVKKSLLHVLEITENKNLSALLQLSQFYSNINNVPFAEKYLSMAEQIYPQNPAVLVASARLTRDKGQPKKALALLWKVVDLAPTYSQAYMQLYELSIAGTGSEQFIMHLETMLQNKPERTFYRNLLADTYLQKAQWQLAKGHYEILAADQDYQNLPSVLNNLAIIALPDDSNSALQLIERALSMSERSASLLDTKGWIVATQGKYDQALEILRQAYSMNSNDPSIRYHLAYTLHKLGRINDARSEVQHALGLKQKFMEREAAEKLLQSM